MTLPLPLPDWVPPWAQLAILVAALLFGLMFLLMPFAVFGIKGRLDLLEARLDEIQGEIRSLALRLPEPDGDDAPIPPSHRTHPGDYAHSDRHAGPDYEDYAIQRPPIPPAPQDRRPLPPSAPPRARTEPRLY